MSQPTVVIRVGEVILINRVVRNLIKFILKKKKKKKRREFDKVMIIMLLCLIYKTSNSRGCIKTQSRQNGKKVY